MVDPSRKSFAIVPAAGQSRRMGTSKLLLPWGGATIIDAVLNAWTASHVDCVVVVVRNRDIDLQAAVARWPVAIVTPGRDPADMKASIQLGLQYLSEHLQPGEADRCFIAPADLPTLTVEIIDGLLATESAEIVVPKFGSQQGHPALLPWPLTRKIFELPENAGVNRIVQQHEKTYVAFSAEKMLTDVDTPQQYEQLLRKSGTK